MKKYLDEDGYPTEKALKLIEEWDYKDFEGLLAFVKDLWWYDEWGWDVVEIGEKLNHTDEIAKRKTYYLSTGGWSGNEDIIRAMEKNWMLWWMIWYQSRRGGHYIFEAPKVTFKSENAITIET